MKKPQVGQRITVQGEVTEVTPANGKKFTLAELQSFVSGQIELVKLPNGRDMWINEEGKILGLQLNPAATAMSGLWPQDVIVGDVLKEISHARTLRTRPQA